MKILIVDDSNTMRMIMKKKLKQAGFGNHEMIEANGGKEALKLIRTSPPDLVLSDWNMPDMTGIELLKLINAVGRKLPFFFVTTQIDEDTKKSALEAGAHSVISKPYTEETLQKVLKPFLSRE